MQQMRNVIPFHPFLFWVAEQVHPNGDCTSSSESRIIVYKDFWKLVRDEAEEYENVGR